MKKKLEEEYNNILKLYEEEKYRLIQLEIKKEKNPEK